MDPFTQRMLDRARLRREKLDTQLINAGQEAPKKRSPLQEQQSQTHSVKITTEEVTYSKPRCAAPPPPREPEPSVATEDSEDESKENVSVDSDSDDETFEREGETENKGCAIRDDARNRLQRLGALYSGSPTRLSSPIHRTEEKFFAEDSPVQPQAKAPARTARLAALANTINQWEDDLSHPTATHDDAEDAVTTESNVERCSVVKLQMKSTGVAPVTKKIVWDKKILDSLDSPVKTAPSSSASTAAVKESWLNSAPQSSPTSNKPNPSWRQGLASANSSSNLAKSPEKQPFLPASPTKTVSSPRMGVANFRSVANSPEKKAPGQVRNAAAVSPRKQAENGSPAAGSVLHKAAIFESVSPTKRKDPAEMTLTERMALFERNKGEALVPRCPFGQAPPVQRQLKSENKPQVRFARSPEKGSVTSVVKPVEKAVVIPKVVPNVPVKELPAPASTAGPNNTVSAQREMFERGGGRVAHQTIAETAQTERQKEMAMLMNRWNANKNIEEPMEVEEPAKTSFQPQTRQELSTPPPPPPMPTASSQSPMRSNVSTPQLHASPPRRMSPQKSLPRMVTPQKVTPASPKASPERQYPVLGEVKRIRVSPPKPGHIYPCLSDIEAATETETEADVQDSDDYNSSYEMDSSVDAGDTSFGRSILQAVSQQNTPMTRTTSGVSQAESDVLDDMDDFLEEALDDSSSTDSDGPTPPKKSRSPKKHGKSPSTAASHSFKYSRGTAPTSASPHVPSHVVDDGQQLPLLHTVSFYRRQQNMGSKHNTPVRQVTRQPETVAMTTLERKELPTDEDGVRTKITSLLEEVSKQQTVISQASQALNLCSSTVEFSGSAESVEGERLLLLATHRRQAALNEVQRLKVEGSLKPLTEYGQNVDLTEKGTLTVTNVTLPLKKDYVRNIVSADHTHYFMCLLRHQEQVVATQAVAATKATLSQGVQLAFGGALKLADLYSDFKVALEVYALQARTEMLPHDVKYHINNKRDGKGRLTPKKKNESRLVMPMFQSPAGPGAVRSPSFQLAGYVVFSLRELARTQFTLNKVAYTSPLEGQVHLRLDSQLTVDVTQRGFLTMFEDVSGFGAWHRRWCLLKGATLSYWKYPDDEKKKVPIGGIDLTTCSTSSVDLVSRDICARSNTFLLETTRPLQPDDQDSLVLVRSKSHTTIRHLLSADTRDERVLWCAQLNKSLAMLRTWNNKRQSE